MCAKCALSVLERGSMVMFAKGVLAYIHLQTAFLSTYILTFANNFNCIVCLIVALVSLICFLL